MTWQDDQKKVATGVTDNNALNNLRNMVDVQGQHGNWNFDPYMQGLYNGLEFALSIMERREPIFKSAPDKWLADNDVKRVFGDVNEAH